jgi:hypothetical protein
MFSLETEHATLNSVNLRAELHGDDHVPAVDLGLTMDLPNTVLSDFGPQLRASLYAKSAGAKKDAPPQGELDVVAPVSDLPHLKNACIDGAIKIRFEGAGYTVRIDYGLGGDHDLVLTGAKVNQVRVTPKEGGTITLTLRIQVTSPEQSAIGLLGNMIGNEVTISLEPPKADQERIAA